MPARYEVFIRRSAEKEIEALEQTDHRRVVAAILALAGEPRPRGCEKLAGRDAWRVRAGRFRVLYTIEDDRLIVEVVRVAHRREAYR